MDALVFAGGDAARPRWRRRRCRADAWIVAADSGLDHVHALGRRRTSSSATSTRVSADDARARGRRAAPWSSDTRPTRTRPTSSSRSTRPARSARRGHRPRRRRRPARPPPRQPAARRARRVGRPRARRARRRHARVVVVRADAPSSSGPVGSIVSLLPVGGPAPRRHHRPGCAGRSPTTSSPPRLDPRRQQRDRPSPPRPSASTDGVLLAIQPDADPDLVTPTPEAPDVRLASWPPARSARSCSPRAAAAASLGERRPADDTVTLVTHDSFAVSKPVLQAFTKQTGIKVRGAEERRRRRRAQPGDPHQGRRRSATRSSASTTRSSSRALDAEVFEPYTADGARPRCPPRCGSTRPARVTPVDFGDVCVNYDKEWFAREHARRADARSTTSPKPAYKDQLVVENPATSLHRASRSCSRPSRSTADGWLDYWDRLRANGVQVVDGWEQAYDGEFSGAAGSKGDCPLVVSYASSPPAEVYFAEPTADDRADRRRSPTPASARSSSSGVLHGAAHPARPRRSSSTSCSREQFQADIPLQMFVFPARDRHAAAGGVHEVRRRCPPTRSRSRRRRSARTATTGSSSGPNTVLR